ncbi:MAG: LON peptidase substrate-binding domain-containing protein, partial [Patescibacteria group bacterium]
MSEKVIKLTRQVPIVAIRGSVVFPHTDTLLSFGRQKSVLAVNSAFQQDRVVAIFSQKDPKTVDPDQDDLYKVGTIATITQMMQTDGEIHALIRGQARIKLSEIVSHEPFLLGRVVELDEERKETPEIKALANNLSGLFKKAINLGKQIEVVTVMKIISGQVDAHELSDQVASLLDLKVTDKQKILEMLELKPRLEKVHKLLNQEINVLDLERTINVKTQKRFEDQMKKAMLRERKRTIEKELGEMDETEITSEEISEYKKKIKEAKMPKEVRKKAEKELKRLSQLSPQNPEGGYL